MLRRLGYVATALSIDATTSRTCRLRNATPQRLRELIDANLCALDDIIRFNEREKIRLYRISSGLIPFGSHPVNTVPWWEEFADRFGEIGRRIKTARIRVSMHPGQYTLLNSPVPAITTASRADLHYHARVLDLLEVPPEGKLVLHVGGVYGNRVEAIERFIQQVQTLLGGCASPARGRERRSPVHRARRPRCVGADRRAGGLRLTSLPGEPRPGACARPDCHVFFHLVGPGRRPEGAYQQPGSRRAGRSARGLGLAGRCAPIHGRDPARAVRLHARGEGEGSRAAAPAPRACRPGRLGGTRCHARSRTPPGARVPPRPERVTGQPAGIPSSGHVTSCARTGRVPIVCDNDVDGLCAAVIVERGLAGRAARVETIPAGRGEHVHQDAMRGRIRAAGPQALVVLDMGSRPGAILPGVPTLVIDHHNPERGLPPGAVVVNGYDRQPVAPRASSPAWSAARWRRVRTRDGSPHSGRWRTWGPPSRSRNGLASRRAARRGHARPRC